MADEPYIHAGRFIKLYFERKDDDDSVDDLGNLLYSSLAPCPNLGTYVIQNRYAEFLCNFSKHDIEIRKVDKNKKVRPVFP